MRILFSLALGIGLLLGGKTTHAQVLFSYGKHPVTTQDFLKIYNKNNKHNPSRYSDSSVRAYLKLYALFRMKVQVAEDQQLDTTPSVKRELEHYKTQLANTYLIDKAVTDKLVKEAYERLKYNIRVAHILVAVRPSGDSLRAKAKIDSIYQLLTEGKADFADLARQVSDDKSTAENGGELGYITALEVIYPFETVAYNTPVGEVSKPFRTQYGYHILKVEDKRPSPGKVKVAQILVESPEYKGEEGRKAALKEVAEIEKKLKEGVPFETLVSEYSDDRYTNEQGGVMQPFGIGVMDPAYEKAAFALKKPGDISDPVRTKYGYHIIKLIKKIPLQPFEEIRDQLSRKVAADPRAKAAREAYVAQVKQTYHFKEYPKNLKTLLNPFAYDTAARINLEKFTHFKEPLFELNGKKYTQFEFLTFVNDITGGALIGNKVNALKSLYEVYKKNRLQELQVKKLKAENAEFRELIKEYRNGILLFDLMNKKVWSKASKDSTGLENYYEQHADKYQWQPGIDGTIYYSFNQKDLEAFKAYLEKGMEMQDALDAADNETHTLKIAHETGRYPYSKFPVPSSSLKEGSASDIFKNIDSSYAFVWVTKIHPNPEPQSLAEARGFVVADYQDYLEKEWNRELMKKFPVKVNKRELKKIIK